MKTEQLVSSPMGDADGNDELEDEIVVEVVDDTPEDDRGRVAPGRSLEDHDAELTNVSKNVQNRIKKLKYDFHEERRSKESATRLRDEAVSFAKQIQQENASLRELVSKGEQVLMDEVKTGAARELESAKTKLKRAHEDGDPESMVEAQESLVRASYDSQKAQELIPSDQPAPTAAPTQQQQPNQVQPDPKAAAWGANNPWFRTDREMTAFATAVHENLVSTGVDVQSDEYYEKIDEKMRERFSERFEGEVAFRPEDTQRTRKSRKQPSNVVAPARRSSGGSQRQVQLTKTQVALAEKLGVTPESYAKQLLILESQNG